MKERERSVPRAVSYDRHPVDTISSVVRRGERRFAGAGCSLPADEHLVRDSHLEKGKRIY
jgi:hypothetical protein